MWFGTPNGLSALSAAAGAPTRPRDGLPSNDVNTLFEDRAGVLWVGTAKGIAVVAAAAPCAIGAAAAGAAGLDPRLRGRSAAARCGSTPTDGILRVNRHALLRARVQTDDVRRYGVADGLLGVESVKRHRIVTRTRSGRIWFALTRGLSMADPGARRRRAACRR